MPINYYGEKKKIILFRYFIMPYHISKKNNKWFVYDNSNVQVPSHGFPTKKKARTQEIAVILSQSKRQHKPLSFYFDKKKK